MIAAFQITERVSGSYGLVFENEIGDWIGHEEGAGWRHAERVAGCRGEVRCLQEAMIRSDGPISRVVWLGGECWQ